MSLNSVCVGCGKPVQNTRRKPVPRCWKCWKEFMRANPHLWSHWKGGKITNKQGYVWVLHYTHPHRNKHCNRIAEHRLVAEKTIGRLLRKGEVVHHLNGIRDDNRPENLEVIPSQGYHMQIFHKRAPLCCIICGKFGQTRKGYCQTHYSRWRVAGFPESGPPDKPKNRTCSECDRPYLAKGLCRIHYYQKKALDRHHRINSVGGA